MKKSILYIIGMILLVFSAYAASPDIAWTTCRNVTIDSLASSINLGNQSIVGVNITGLNIVSNAKNELRMDNEPCNQDTDSNFSINTFTVLVSDNSTFATIGFMTDESHTGGTNLIYSIYYNTSAPTDPLEKTQVTVWDSFTDPDGFISGHVPDYSACSTSWTGTNGMSINNNRGRLDTQDLFDSLDVSGCLDNTTFSAFIADGLAEVSLKDWKWAFADTGTSIKDTILSQSGGTNLVFFNNGTSNPVGDFPETGATFSYTTKLLPDVNQVFVDVRNQTQINFSDHQGVSSFDYTSSFFITARSGSTVANGIMDNMVIWNGSDAERVMGYFPQSNIIVGEQQLLPVQPPVLISPLNTTISSMNQTLTWANTTGATNYFVSHDFNNSDPVNVICETTDLTCQANATSDEGTYFWNVIAANAIGNSSDSETFQWTYDITNVIINFIFPVAANTTLTNVNIVMNVTVNNVNLDTVIVNVTDPVGTEIFTSINTSIAEATVNIIESLSLSTSGNHTIRVFGNDSAGASSDQSITFSFDNVNPVFTGIGNDGSNDTFPGGSVTFNANITDNIGLSLLTFSFNDTGVFVNDSPVVISGVSDTFGVLKTITAGAGETVCGTYFAEDLHTNEIQSGFTCFVVATPTPPILDATTRGILGLALPVLAVLIFLTIANQALKTMGKK